MTVDYEAETLLEPRSNSASWASPEGPVLLGGDESGNTTENVRTGQLLFPLKYQTSKACGINLGSSVVVTGGAGDLLHTVSEYNLEGWTRNGLTVFLQQYFKGGCAGRSRLKC